MSPNGNGVTQVNEKSAARLTVSWFDFDGAPSVPESVSYQVLHINGPVPTALRGPTPADPAAVVQILLTSADTAFVSTKGRTERHRVVVTATYGAGNETNIAVDFDVVNLEGIA
jgi:hypothetical protein